jgi:hypothetical protein
MSLYDQFAEDIPAFVRGKLEPARAKQIADAAQQDQRLKRAIEEERALDRWLEYYEVPEPTAGLSATFWKRFYASRGGSGTLLIKLAGPIAAAVMIALGLILFINTEDAPTDDPATTAEVPNEPEADDEFHFFDYLANGDEPREVNAPTVEELALLKQLDDPAFAELDKLRHPDDLMLIQDQELLAELAAKEAE